MLTIEKMVVDTKIMLEKFTTNLYDSLKTHGSEFMEALEAVEKIIDKLQKGNHGNAKAKGSLFHMPNVFLIALVKMVHEHMNKKFMAVCPPVHLDQQYFALSKRFAQFAIKIYSASWAWDLELASQEMGIEPKSILFAWFHDHPNGPYCPKFMIFLDHPSRSIVIAIRGTLSLTDVIIDVKGHQDKFLDGYAHAGLLKGAKTLLKISGNTLKSALKMYPMYSLALTGHSLGAGTAILITMEMLAGKVPNIVDPKRTKIRCTALAPPPVYRSRSSLSEMDKYVGYIDIFTYGNDFIPRLSLATMAKLMSSLQYMDQVPLGLSQALTLIMGWESSERASARIEILSQVLEKVDQDAFAPLEHPGQMFHLRQVQPNKVKMFLVPRQYFTHSLFILDSMVTDHLHGAYLEAFNKVEL